MNIAPARAIGWTCVGSILATFSPFSMFDFALSISIIFLIVITTRSLKAIRAFLYLSLPFFLPLLVIHGVVNPQFEQSNVFMKVPIRTDGINFALSICSNLSVFLSIAIGWWYVERDYFVDWLIARNFPTLLISLITQAAAMIPIIERRGAAVRRAQTARGIPTGPEFRHRIRAIPSVLLPVITSLINEADHRSYALWSRGFGQYKFSGEKLPYGNWSDLLYVLVAAILPIAVALLGI